MRKRGDAVLERYATKFDGLAKGAALRVSREEMKVAWEATAPELRAAMKTAKANIRAFAEKQKPGEWMFAPRRVSRPDRLSAAGERGLLRSGRPLSVTVHPADDSDAGPWAGVERIVVCFPCRPGRRWRRRGWRV